jgi:hypothetical protein
MAVIDPALVSFLEGPCAQNVATSDLDGAPTAGRAWGVRVAAGRFVRALVGADPATAANLEVTRRIALMVIDVATYRSVQVKGTITAVQPPTAADHDVYDLYVREFASALVAEGRNTPLDQALPGSFLAVSIDVDALFDQTPGPTAGQPIASAS